MHLLNKAALVILPAVLALSAFAQEDPVFKSNTRLVVYTQPWSTAKANC